MGAKDIVLRPIDRREADAVVRRVHYSGKVVQNSQLHIGVFYQGRLEGAMQFGPSLDKRKIQGLVVGTPWNGFIELNRMAFTDALPRNSESRALSVAMRLLRKYAPHVQWVVTFADGAQCGDGTIYRAAGFVLTGIAISKNLVRLPSGMVVHKMTLESSPTAPRAELGGRSYYDVTGGRYDLAKYARLVDGVSYPRLSTPLHLLRGYGRPFAPVRPGNSVLRDRTSRGVDVSREEARRKHRQRCSRFPIGRGRGRSDLGASDS